MSSGHPDTWVQGLRFTQYCHDSSFTGAASLQFLAALFPSAANIWSLGTAASSCASHCIALTGVSESEVAQLQNVFRWVHTLSFSWWVPVGILMQVCLLQHFESLGLSIAGCLSSLLGGAPPLQHSAAEPGGL